MLTKAVFFDKKYSKNTNIVTILLYQKYIYNKRFLF